MAKSKPPYQCLARSRFGLAGVGSLWLGPDHLVLVSNVFAAEHYRRWYFKDLQAMIARRTVRRLIWNIVIGGGGAVLALGAVGCVVALSSSKGSDREALIVCAVILGVLALGCLAIVIVNTMLGAGCEVHLQTPLGVDKLSIPSRLPAFNRIAARLQPMIEAAQSAPQGTSGSAEAAPLTPP